MQKFYVPILLVLSLGIALAAAQMGSTTVRTAEDERFGKYLTDSEGESLYLLANDERGEPSTCYDECAEKWPPLIVEEAPAAGEGVAPSLLGTVERRDGSLQATYFGWPLYYFAGDEATGDTNGHGAGDVWFLVSPYGEAIEPVETETAEDSEGGVPAAAQGVDTEDVTQDAGDEEEAEAETEPESAEDGGKPAAAQGVDTDEVTQDAGDETISSEVLAQGRSVYRSNCAACHGAEGGGGSGPTLAGNSKLENEEQVLRQILKGGSFMPPFGGQLSDEEVAAVATHIRNSWDNAFGLTTPDEVNQAR